MSFPLTSPAKRNRSPLAAGTLLTLVLALSLAVCCLVGCLGSNGSGSEADSTAAGDSTVAETDSTDGAAKEEKAIKVNVGQVRQGDLVLPVFADGAIKSPQFVEIKARVGGQLLDVLVRDGDRVKRDQLLAQIDAREYEIALQESRYRHLQALSQMATEADTFSVDRAALNDYDSRRMALDSLRDRGSLSREEYQSRLLALEMQALQEGAFREAVFEQRTGLAEARMAEDRAKLDLEHCQIRAPFAGVVQNLSMVAGEMITTGATVCQVYNNDHLEAAVNVLEADLGNLEEGRPVLLAVPATRDTIQAVIDVISPSLDQTTRTCEVLIRFDNPAGRYRPGMFVRAMIAGWVHHDKLLVPKAAILIRDNRPLVFKKEEDRARWLYVDTGLENEDWVEILGVHSGGSLSPGDQVVVSDHLTLAHEARISVRKQVPPADRWDFIAAGDEALLRSGDAALATKDYEQALSHFEKLLKDFPGSKLAPAAHFKCRTCLLKLGRNEAAWDHGGELLKRFPDSPEAVKLKQDSGSSGTPDSGGSQFADGGGSGR